MKYWILSKAKGIMIRLPEPENNLSFFLSDHILFQEGDRSQMKASKRIRNGDVHVETT